MCIRDRLTDELFEQLHNIDVALGTRKSMDEGCKVETYPPQGNDSFKFGSLFELSLIHI